MKTTQERINYNTIILILKHWCALQYLFPGLQNPFTRYSNTKYTYVHTHTHTHTHIHTHTHMRIYGKNVMYVRNSLAK